MFELQISSFIKEDSIYTCYELHNDYLIFGSFATLITCTDKIRLFYINGVRVIDRRTNRWMDARLEYHALESKYDLPV